MRKPEIWMTNLKLLIKHKSWFLVAGWTANKGDELHGDYEYVKDREQWEKLLNDLKKSEWNTDSAAAVVAILKMKLINYGARDAWRE